MSLTLSGPHNTGPAVIEDYVGVASKDTPLPLTGTIVAIAWALHVSGTPDLIITTKGLKGHPPIVEILSNSPTEDGWHYPSAGVSDNEGSAVSGAYMIGIPISDYVNIAIDNADEDDNIDVWFLIES